MKLFVSHISALRYWRREEGLGDSVRARITSLNSAIGNVKDAKQLDPTTHGLIMGIEHPLNVLICRKEDRRYARSLKPRVWTEGLPYNAFRRIAPNLYVSSPEFVFVQMAAQLSVVELAQLGNELCGGYFLLPRTGFSKHVNKKPLTTRTKLVNFVKSVPNARGAQKALNALRWVANHCNSPMETNTLLMLCLPGRTGGWGLPMPTYINKVIHVGKRLARYVGGRIYIPDFLWEIEADGKTIRVVGEYDSSDCHDDPAAAQRTRIRRNDMKSMGYLVTSINTSQIESAERFQYPARQIARDLGIYRRKLSAVRLRKQNELLRLLSREAFR